MDSIEPLKRTRGTTLGTLPTPQRTGESYDYTFEGWFTQAEGGEKVTDQTQVWGDMTLTARWSMQWSYDETTNTLRVSAEDAMKNYTGDNPQPQPWENYMDKVKILLLPEELTKIGEGAFCGFSALQEVKIPVNVTDIGGGAFSVCSNLKTVMIPAGVQTIGNWAFAECASVVDIYFGGTKETWESLTTGKTLFRQNPTPALNKHFNQYTPTTPQ